MTVYRTAKEAEQVLKRIQETNQARLAAIRAKIDARNEKRMDISDLSRELAQAHRIAENSERIAQKNLDESRAREATAQAAQDAAQAAKLAQVNQERKNLAARVWAANGGSPAEFEAAWPTIRQELLVRDAITEIPTAKVEKTGFDRL